MPHQISVFMENRPGKLERITDLLADEGINIRAITITDSGDFGILKMLVNDPEKARDILVNNGVVAVMKEVVAIKVMDSPGGLHDIGATLTRNNINIDDAYGFVLDSGSTAVFVIQVKSPDQVSAILKKEGFPLLEERDLYYL